MANPARKPAHKRDEIGSAVLSVIHEHACQLTSYLANSHMTSNDIVNARWHVDAIVEMSTIVDGPVSTSSADTRLGSWLSAALEDPNVCADMKADIEAWFAERGARCPCGRTDVGAGPFVCGMGGCPLGGDL